MKRKVDLRLVISAVLASAVFLFFSNIFSASAQGVIQCSDYSDQGTVCLPDLRLVSAAGLALTPDGCPPNFKALNKIACGTGKMCCIKSGKYDQFIKDLKEKGIDPEAGTLSEVVKTAGSALNDLADGKDDKKIVVPDLMVHIPGVSFSTKPQYEDCGGGKCLVIPFLAQYIQGFYKYILGIGLIAAAVMFVYGGFLYMLGATGIQVSDAKKKMIDALLGLIILIGAYVILANVSPQTLKLDAIKFPEVERLEFKKKVGSLNLDSRGNIVGGGETSAVDPSSLETTNGCTIDRLSFYSQCDDNWKTKSSGDKPTCVAAQAAERVIREQADAPCCLPICTAGNGAASLASVLASYGERVTPLDVVEFYTAAGKRNCNYGGFDPTDPAVFEHWPGYMLDSSVTTLDLEKVNEILKKGKPIIFSCENCTVFKKARRGQVANPGSYCTAEGKPQCRKYAAHYMLLVGVYEPGKYAIFDVAGNGYDLIEEDQLQNGSVRLHYIRPSDDRLPIGCD